MARTLEFDRDAAVRAARAVFWRQGYAEASLPDLEKATGLGRSSIYNSFGSKRGLFDAAVQSYLDEVIRPRLRPLQQDEVEPSAITDYLDGLTRAFSQGTAARQSGCLLVNTAGTNLAADGDIARIITDYRRELHTAIGYGVRAFDPRLGAEQAERLTNTVTDLVVAAFALVRVAPEVALRTLHTARETLAERPSQRTSSSSCAVVSAVSS
ncbi:MAG: TetR/AcrR family transcriptional regulator [Micrococcaceae bacterium]